MLVFNICLDMNDILSFQSAVGFDYQEKLAAHESQTGMILLVPFLHNIDISMALDNDLYVL